MRKDISNILIRLNLDAFFRRLNRERLLVVAYHGVCHRDKCPPLFTHLPSDIFDEHLQYFVTHYNLISMEELLVCFKKGLAFPDRAALITFDDGFMNNYQVAFPLLKKYNVPATIFLTVDYIGTENLLWFDDLFLHLKLAFKASMDISLLENLFSCEGLQNNISSAYPAIARKLKRVDHLSRLEKISGLKDVVSKSSSPDSDNFKLLTWDQVREMKESGLIEFGVHTATHRILSELPADEWESEIVEPKARLSEFLGCEISSFCYPNGIPDLDFTWCHEDYLRKAGYICAFSMGEWLNVRGDNSFRIGRISLGNNISSDRDCISLSTSGLMPAMKKIFNKR